MHQDRDYISQLILQWGYFRDHGMWSELDNTFHADGEIKVTWFVGAFSDFVSASKEMAKQGAKSTHVMNPSIINVNGNRAIAITPVTIKGRAKAALGVEVDLTSEAQFFDYIEKREGQWRILRRTCIYQKDRIDSVLPSFKFWLLGLFMSTDKYDPAYRHLGFVLEKAGFEIQAGQIVDNSQASRQLFEQGMIWLQQLPITTQ